MRPGIFSLAFVLLLAGLPAHAEERELLGIGRLFVNDMLGDGQDRWRSGAYSVSAIRGPADLTERPAAFGVLMEYRFANRILAPANTVAPAPGDRRYAGVLSLGAWSHFASGGTEVSIGSEFVAAGPMTGVSAFQTGAHGLLGLTPPAAAVLNSQFPNAVYPTIATEFARPIGLGAHAMVRPFVAGRLGDETYLRLGADLLVGSALTSGVTVRDESTGLLYQTLDHMPANGFSFLLGADTAKVFSSVWLPSATQTLTPLRNRLRAGLHWQGDHVGLFYGVTWLGREFTAQPSGQTLGAVQLQIRF